MMYFLELKDENQYKNPIKNSAGKSEPSLTLHGYQMEINQPIDVRPQIFADIYRVKKYI